MIGAGLRVLVVGAGIGGLGAARALRQRGFAADVLEREPAWTHTGAGIYLPGSALRALHALGLESAVAERASLISHQRLCDHRGRLLADIDTAALWGDVGPCLALHRADLHEVLASRGDPLPIRMGISLQGLSQQDGTVTVEFDDGSAGRYDLVIGADGIHSTVRQLAVGADAVRPVGQVAWRFVTECPPEVTTWTVLLGRGITFLAVPNGRGQVYCYCDAHASSTPRPEGDDVSGRLAAILAGFAAPVPALLDTLGPAGAVHVSPIEEVTPRPVVMRIGAGHRGRGARDVANMAEGAAMALEDGLISPSALPPGAASPRRWRPSRLGAAHARNGSLPRRTTGTAPATCHPPCATWCCADGDATSSTPSTNRFSNSPDGASLRCRGTAETTRIGSSAMRVVGLLRGSHGPLLQPSNCAHLVVSGGTSADTARIT
jgi:2-polyprenyl-6-methoxyphenol hydroxylase-like FAD-dependent oxidoreductase